jgi:hypothetical protein
MNVRKRHGDALPDLSPKWREVYRRALAVRLGQPPPYGMPIAPAPKGAE